jgi:signal transduction histidine kinase
VLLNQREDLKMNEKLLALSSFLEKRTYITLLSTVCISALGGILIVITGLDLLRLVRALRDSRDLNLEIQEAERRRIAQDLHDDVIQRLIEINRTLSLEQQSRFKVETLIHSIRRICQNLKPHTLEDLGLKAALESLVGDLSQNSTIQYFFEEENLEKLPKPYELPVFRLIQEGLNNTQKHSQANKARVQIVYDCEESQTLRVYIEDNGQGFSLQNSVKGMGLMGLKERIDRLSGRMMIDSQPGKGCKLQFIIPVDAEQVGIL